MTYTLSKNLAIGWIDAVYNFFEKTNFIYFQTAHGKNGKIMRIPKFQTMTTNPDKIRKNLKNYTLGNLILSETLRRKDDKKPMKDAFKETIDFMQERFGYGNDFKYKSNLFERRITRKKKRKIVREYGGLWYGEIKNKIDDIATAPKLVSELLQIGVLTDACSKKPYDPRPANAFSRFARKWTLDEILHLPLILTGKIKLVGIRPQMVGLLDTESENELIRELSTSILEDVNAGFTGYIPPDYGKNNRVNRFGNGMPFFGLTKEEKLKLKGDTLASEARAVTEYRNLYEKKSPIGRRLLALEYASNAVFAHCFRGHISE